MSRQHKKRFFFLFIFFLAAGAIGQEAIGEEPQQVIESPAGMTFVYIPPGEFMMGSPVDEKGRNKDEETPHKVTLTRGFYMQTTEVTVGQWRAFSQATGYRSDAETKGGAKTMKDNEWQVREGRYWDSPGFEQADDYPVTCISWKDAQAFAEWLSTKEGKPYRLPFEAEWEYACRAGTTSRFGWGNKTDCSKANFGNSWTNECKRKESIRTVKVAGYSPNAWGLYDMVGNVWEWCQDWYGKYPDGHVTDPQGASSGERRVVRGGSWWSYSRYCRSAARGWCGPEDRWFTLGFRLVREP